MEPFETTDHPIGGTIHWYQAGNRLFSILVDYPHADDVELHERDPLERTPIPGTEQHFPTLTAAEAAIPTGPDPKILAEVQAAFDAATRNGRDNPA